MATAPRVKHSKLDHVDINQGLTVVYPDPDQPKRSSSDEIAVDIVAVPGLGASPEWTWRSRNKVDWLRDSNMLPRLVTNARIMIFEYESQWFGKGSINQRLSTVADQLLQALFYQRPVSHYDAFFERVKSANLGSRKDLSDLSFLSVTALVVSLWKR